jgi:hypothetical protein
VLAKPGAALRLRFRSTHPTAEASISELVLGLWGTASWTTRYIWATNQPGSQSLPSGAPQTLETLCQLPGALPEDTYQTTIVINRQDSLLSFHLGLQLRILAAWSEKLPEHWPEPLHTNLLGDVAGIKIDGLPIGLAEPLLVAKPGSTLEMSGWVADPASAAPDPEVLLALSAIDSDLARYVHADGFWRPDVVQTYPALATDFCGFNLAVRLPVELPAGDYRLWLFQKSGRNAGRLDIHRILRVHP